MFASDVEFSAAARFWWATTWRALPVYVALNLLLYITGMSAPISLLVNILVIAGQIGLIYYVLRQNNHRVGATAPTWIEALSIWWGQLLRGLLLLIPIGILDMILAMLSLSLFGKGWQTVLLLTLTLTLTLTSLALPCLVNILSLRGVLDDYRQRPRSSIVPRR